MDAFPNEEEEFELMYQDEFELLREQEDFQPIPKSKRSLDFSESNSQPKNTEIPNLTTSGPIPTPSSNKRTIEELFGDIDDILNDGIFRDAPFLKKKRVDEAQSSDLALIEHIVEVRKANRERITKNISTLGTSRVNFINRNSDNISSSIPNYPYVALINHDGDRVYIRCHSDDYERRERLRIAKESSFVGVMGSVFKDVWKEATEYINKNIEQIRPENIQELTLTEDNKDLWVDIYKPRKYYELLSDEGTNRILLKWLKLWDKAVFNRKPKPKLTKPDQLTNAKNFQNSKFQKQELNLELDADGRPKYKVALLCGPPGLGKTTLAHMVARHCGYNVVEINASDDRNLDQFKNALENATSMKSVLDLKRRPNCLVFDEIDGAPSNSIEYLIKFINGINSSKKGKKQTKGHVLKRPIICICNDVYVPSLRNLRQIAFIVNFPPTASTRLAERLNEISRYQAIKTDMGALLALAEKTHNDIRSCLSILHLFKTQNKPVTLSDVWKTNIGQKDMQKGLFAVWQDIFQTERPKGPQNSQDHNTTLRHRAKKILDTVQSFGDYEKLAQGVFENFPHLCVRDSSLNAVVEAEEWFSFGDILSSKIGASQDYSLGVYIPYGFVMWHFVFGGFTWPKINYPNIGYEARLSTKKRESLITEILKGMPPSIKTFSNASSLKLDTLPHLNQIITPAFRPVNLHLYTEKEKSLLRTAIDVMIDYNLTYVQERTPEGSYAYNLDPNLEEIVMFPGFKPTRTLSYANRQMIAQEIELEKMRRTEEFKRRNDDSRGTGKKKKEDAGTAKGEETVKEVPNHLQRLHVKSMGPKAPVVTKDFFGRIVTKPQRPIEERARKASMCSDIYFQFKEGCTNAVRKPVKVKALK